MIQLTRTNLLPTLSPLHHDPLSLLTSPPFLMECMSAQQRWSLQFFSKSGILKALISSAGKTPAGLMFASAIPNLPWPQDFPAIKSLLPTYWTSIPGTGSYNSPNNHLHFSPLPRLLTMRLSSDVNKEILTQFHTDDTLSLHWNSTPRG